MLFIHFIYFIIFCYQFYLFYYKYDSSKRRNISNKQKLPILKDFIHIIYKVAHENNFHPIIFYGTLLGYIREKKILCHDFDIDIIIDETEFYLFIEKLKIYIEEKTSYIFKTYLYYNTKFCVIIDPLTKLNCDIFMISKTKDGKYFKRNVLDMYSTYVLNECNTKHLLTHLYPLKKDTFENTVIYYPNNPDYFLKCFYGKNFITPNVKCDKNCDNCILIKK